ncbi:MAG: hypothetical protein J3Q66DRAFT_430000 [Benniella sp.]|nr:MAG: hypothetical protein J3Q66DRAFT_430000 [Benniella sp.]
MSSSDYKSILDLTKYKSASRSQGNGDGGFSMSSSLTPRVFVFRNGVYTLGPIRIIQPPVHENRGSIDSASISSGGSHSIPDQFYQASIGSRSSGIDTHDEENSDVTTPESSKVDLSVPVIEELDDDPSDRRLSHPVKPKEQYQKHTGRFADAAPRAILSNTQRGYLDPRKEQTKKINRLFWLPNIRIRKGRSEESLHFSSFGSF